MSAGDASRIKRVLFEHEDGSVAELEPHPGAQVSAEMIVVGDFRYDFLVRITRPVDKDVDGPLWLITVTECGSE